MTGKQQRAKTRARRPRRNSGPALSSFLQRALPGLGISSAVIMWGLGIEYFYVPAAAGIGLAAILALAGRVSKPTLVGIDVGHSAIKMVELTRGSPPMLLRYSITPTPEGAVSDGVVRSRDLVAQGLAMAVAESGIKTSEVVTVMTGQTLVLQHLDFPRMRDTELRNAVADQITTHVPMPAEEILFDYQRVPSARDDVSRVLLVATQREPVVALVETMHEAGLTPTRVDIEPLAGYRAVFGPGASASSEVGSGETGRQSSRDASVVQVLVDLGAGTSNVSIYLNGVLQLQRVLRVAGDDFTRAVSIGLRVDREEAERLKQQHGLLPGSPIAFAVQPVAESLFREIRLALEFFHSRNREVPFTDLALIGGNARLQGLSEQLMEHLRASLEGLIDTAALHVFIPTWEGRIKTAASDNSCEEHFPVLAVAVGLALGEVSAHGGR